MNVRPTTDEITLDASLSMHVLDLKDQSGQTATPGQDAASKAEADVKTTSAGFPSGGLNLIVLIAAIVLSSFLLWKFGVFGSGESGQSIPVVGQETPVKTIRPAVTSTAKDTREQAEGGASPEEAPVRTMPTRGTSNEADAAPRSADMNGQSSDAGRPRSVPSIAGDQTDDADPTTPSKARPLEDVGVEVKPKTLPAQETQPKTPAPTKKKSPVKKSKAKRKPRQAPKRSAGPTPLPFNLSLRIVLNPGQMGTQNLSGNLRRPSKPKTCQSSRRSMRQTESQSRHPIA